MPKQSKQFTALYVFVLIMSLITFLFLFTAAAYAGNFGVSPLDLQFNVQSKSGIVTVSNDDTKTLSLRVKAMRWTQDSEGRDVYAETSDLVYFPKRFELKPGEQRVVRAGLDQVVPGAEKAYRLYIEEIPPADLPRDGGSKLAVLLSIGIPVFISPLDTTSSALISTPKFSTAEELSFSMQNTGQKRIRISQIQTADGIVVADGVASRYVFPGITKAFVVKANKVVCEKPTKLLVEADSIKVRGTDPVLCTK